MHFKREDRVHLESLTFDPMCEPSYEWIRACLIWPDERPTKISSDGYELLGDLWIVRGFIHKHVPRERWGLDPEYFQEVWENALVDVPNWPGFRRMQLSISDQAYMDVCAFEAHRGL